ncbi:hypothetical protein AMELA_G00137650 [Ameiurus melas]|uniref:trypsin n=1 Tax=Ameiurus melas TaxID=219545 RepID=A0A7J6AKN1_AMEME|nr:hypothetical protein AMELA_G00137650 [Ameiurus melas]
MSLCARCTCLSLLGKMKALHILLLTAAFSIHTFKATHGEEIINGKKAKKNSLQFMASVQLNNKHRCGGFLISPSYVLTAAHCGTDNLSVVLGTQNIDEKRNKLSRYPVKSMHIHPSYKNPRYGSDIMLLKFSGKVNLNKDLKVIKISSNRKHVKPNTKCQVAGWGKTENQSMEATEPKVEHARVILVGLWCAVVLQWASCPSTLTTIVTIQMCQMSTLRFQLTQTGLTK